MILLLMAGIGVILAGLVAIGFGIPVKEFGFGNTLILTGTIGACTGLIMISLAIVVREIRHFVPAAAEPEPAAMPRLPRPELPALSGESRSTDKAEAPSSRPLFSGDEQAAERAAAAPPWQDEASRDRVAPEAPAVEEPPEEPKRRNLLFSSTRRERERAEAERAAAEAGTAQPEAAPARPSFAEAWPAAERSRPELPRRPARPPSTFADADPEPPLIPERYVPPSPSRREAPAADTAEVTVLKSGVVDGMAYSLYSDGSIEAQMPEGMMRFASIDDLREHLDQRG
jgi:hypothetical protein